MYSQSILFLRMRFGVLLTVAFEVMIGEVHQRVPVIGGDLVLAGANVDSRSCS